uniref:Uncharacterized protein n=1 Tax=Candidatus Kentrum sp. TC TaxID=2126339 RepID=A0A450Z0C4_9GAMM|nr:MAG: hypothetical protein BECKTC1821D_GA0114238_104324 [Candidatus Kentron sp. TC]
MHQPPYASSASSCVLGIGNSSTCWRNRSLPSTLSTTVLTWRQSKVGHQLFGRIEATDITQLAQQHHGRYLVYSPQGDQGVQQRRQRPLRQYFFKDAINRVSTTSQLIGRGGGESPLPSFHTTVRTVPYMVFKSERCICL